MFPLSVPIPFVLLIASILELDELYLGSLYYFFFLFSSPLYLHVQCTLPSDSSFSPSTYLL